MSPSPQQVRTLVEHCEQFRSAKAPGGYPESLALCIVDSVQSTGVTYSSVVNVRQKYRTYRIEQGADANTDGARELVDSFDELGGPDAWSLRIGNQNKTSTRAGAPLKAVAIRAAANALIGAGVATVQDLLEIAKSPEPLRAAECAWLTVPGQKSGITWHYVQMLAGIEGIKPDRMMIRFVANALGVPPRTIKHQFAFDALMATASEMGMSARDLDHGIWQWQRRR